MAVAMVLAIAVLLAHGHYCWAMIVFLIALLVGNGGER